MPTDDTCANALVSAMAQPAALLDAGGTVLFCNDVFRSCVGQVLFDVSGSHVSQLFGDADRAEVECVLKGETDAFTSTVSLPSGNYRCTLQAIGGQTTGSQTTKNEMTGGATNQAAYFCHFVEDRAIDSSRQHILLDRLEYGVWNDNVQANKFEATNAWYRIHGLPLDLVRFPPPDTRERWLDRVHEDDREALRDMYRPQESDHSGHFTVQYRRKHLDDRWIWVMSRASVLSVDENGVPAHIIGLDSDITDIKENETKMIELAGKSQLAIDVADVGVWEFDSSTNKARWDDRKLEMYGITDGVNLRDAGLWETFLHPEDRATTVAAADTALVENRDFVSEYRIVLASGEVRHLRSRTRHVTVAGTAGKFLGVDIDITDDVRRTEELEIARQKLEHDSRHDALTGLANRRLLDETTQTLMDRLDEDAQFGVLHLDLDYFKKINDTLGHAAGDATLIHVGAIVKSLIGDKGLVCRNGGDEFVVLLYDVASRQDLAALCGTIIKRIAEPMVLQSQVNTFSVSIGGAIGTGALRDPSEVFINADVALYAAKFDGRACYRLFKPGMTPASQREATARQNLLNALDRGEITCHYQPQFDAKTHQIIGAEALVRWNCPERGLLSPDKFMPTAQKQGLVPVIDEYVFNCVLAQQTIWRERGLFVPTISLNISRERLYEDGLAARVIAALHPHHAISFELLETSFLDDADTGLMSTLDILRAAGVGLDLDDFGSGHSSIVAMQALRPDRVKIDRGLVAPLCRRRTQILTLQAMVRLASLDGCGVIIEGVETAEQLEAMKDLDCLAVQGFALARPMKAQDFEQYLSPIRKAARI